MKKHGYIELIEYALKERNFSIEQVCRAIKLPISDFMFIRHEIFILNGNQAEATVHHNELLEWKLSPQAVFGYIQYKAYEDSVESSKRSQKLAIWALGISALSALSALGSIFAGILV
jgi:hypothetical protein